MSSSPDRYYLRSRKNLSEENPIHGKGETLESLPSSQSSSGTQDISTDGEPFASAKGQENESSNKATDETDAEISNVYGKSVHITESRKDSHANETNDRVKFENKEISEKGKNSDIVNKSSSPPHIREAQGIKTDQNKYSSWLCQLCMILPLFCLVLKFGLGLDVLNFHQMNKPNTKKLQYTERPVAYRLGNLTTELEHIKAKYTTLDDSFWDVIAGSSWSHIQGDGSFKRPVVLLLVGQPKSSNLDVVANDVARLYSNVFTMRDDGTIHIDGGWQAMKEADQAKLDMDNLLKNGFNVGRKVVLVSKFDKLPPCSIMLFHSYCDNDNAPHKDAVIIFTVELETAVSNAAQPRGIEELVQQHLGALWEQCPEELLQDKIMAMHSRVSNNIAFVK